MKLCPIFIPNIIYLCFLFFLHISSQICQIHESFPKMNFWLSSALLSVFLAFMLIKFFLYLFPSPFKKIILLLLFQCLKMCSSLIFSFFFYVKTSIYGYIFITKCYFHGISQVLIILLYISSLTYGLLDCLSNFQLFRYFYLSCYYLYLNCNVFHEQSIWYRFFELCWYFMASYMINFYKCFMCVSKDFIFSSCWVPSFIYVYEISFDC